MNWKELSGGVVVTALLLLFALWTTDFEIDSKGGYALAVGIIFVMSVAWRIALNRVVSKDGFYWDKVKAYSLGALVTSVLSLISVL